jgi:hypothetical protein
MSGDAIDHVASIDERIRNYDRHIRELQKQASLAGVYQDTSIPVRLQEYERLRNECYKEKKDVQNQFIQAKANELEAFQAMKTVLSNEHASRWIFSRVIISYTQAISYLENFALADMILAVSATCDQNISRLQTEIATVKKLWNISE